MVYADLTHNPYLLQTHVSFNGHEPKINSQIEKYEKQILKDWVDKVPAIFYDEMNGYDFDLNFTGTKPDFEEIKKAFADAGVSEEDVRLFFKNELEDAITKSEEIDELLKWLRGNFNRKFDYEKFAELNRDLFNNSYPYIIVGNENADVSMADISIETVKSAHELHGTLLANTPVLIYIDSDTLKYLRSNLLELLARKDVTQSQIFFMIHHNLNKDQTIRIISDLGVEYPQIVENYNDELVMAYIRNYPVTEYIREAIKEFEKVTGDISNILDEENEKSIITNAGIHREIDRLENNIRRIKETNEFFTERDNVNVPKSFNDACNSLREKILKWKNRKTKITGDMEIETMAQEYNKELSENMNSFVESIQREYQAICMSVYHNFKEKYGEQGLDRGFSPGNVSVEKLGGLQCPDMSETFINMKEITFVEAKNDIFNIFLKSSAKEEKEPVRVATCHLEHWRSKATEALMPVAEQYIKDVTEILHRYYDALAEAFHIHLDELIVQQSEEKDKVAAQLSDDERKVQEDNDWLAQFKDKLFHIERG